MGRTNNFQFKHFLVMQEQAAMKVGVDGVLLGAWAHFDGCNRILDIGTGTGLIALMAAQRSSAFIDAVEIEPKAANEARSNFDHSEWKERMTVFNKPFQEFDSANHYDHIISNPPFFENSLRAKDKMRSQARHTDSLSLTDLLLKARSLLADSGKISLILPTEKDEQLNELARRLGLFINRKCNVAPDQIKKPHRILVELGCLQISCRIENIFLRNAGESGYSNQYRELTQDFYLER